MSQRVAFFAGLLVGGAFALEVAAFAADPPASAWDELRQLLLVADDRGPQAANIATRQYQAVRAVSDDGRADYARALVLLRLNKPKDAVVSLGRAADLKPRPYLPAARAQVALLLQHKQWATATERLEKIGRALVDQPQWWPAAEDRMLDAAWLGRAVSVGELIAPSAADVTRLSRVDQQVRGVLPKELKTVYTTGFDAVVAESEALAATVAEAESAAKIAQQTEQEAARDKVKEQQTQANANRQNLKLTADEWKKFLDDRLAEFAKQLGTLERQYNTLDQKRQSLERSIAMAQQEQMVLVARGQQIASQAPQGARNAVTIGTTPQLLQSQILDREIGIRQQQIVQYQLERNRTFVDIAGVQQQAQGALAQRQTLVNDYEEATGKLVKQDESLKKWNERLTQKEKDLAETPKGKAASVLSLEQKRHSPATYLSMDWEAERQRWLQELNGTNGKTPAE